MIESGFSHRAVALARNVPTLQIARMAHNYLTLTLCQAALMELGAP
ncbi:Hypothetical protein ETEE_1715 [Edwardsiella anguillarum ET080813]|uniref:Uncharacterized protein n=1 Tax=Edwardsiella anguillarum ET080813 TaxID=667120 RepID=A0A076LRC9_9GAMM|nr:Hypothetical protein ETEE_1715 [Edwardsiella anguillarum ET080813]